EVAVGEHSLRELRLAGVVEPEARVVPRVAAIAGVDGDTEAPRRTEAVLDHQAGPVPEAGIRREVPRSSRDRKPCLSHEGDADGLLHARQAQLQMRDDRRDLLGVELARV